MAFRSSKTITADGYTERFGEAPRQDDLVRVNCWKSGEPGHWLCGVCPEHDKPRFLCGCLAPHRDGGFVTAHKTSTG